MELNAAKNYLLILLNHIFDILFVNKLGVNHAEHVFSCVLELLQNDIHLKEWFIELVRCSLLSDEEDMTNLRSRPNWFVDPDLILYIAHATRWRDFEDIANERKSKLNSIKTFSHEREFSDQLENALKDDWEDKDYYKRFDA